MAGPLWSAVAAHASRMLKPPFTAIGATKPSITIAAAPARKLPATTRNVAFNFSSAGDIVEKLPSRRRSVNKGLTVLQLLLCGAEEIFAVTDVTGSTPYPLSSAA